MKLRTKIISGCSALALVGSIAAVTTAAVPDSDDNEYHACLSNSSSLKTAFIIDKQAGTTCSTGYSEKTWFKNGTPGPAGPAGPQGPAGEDGADGGDPVDYYTKSEGGSINPDGREGKSVACDEGDIATGGGGEYDYVENQGTAFLVDSSHTYIDHGDHNDSGWRVTYERQGGTAGRGFVVMVRCADFGTPH